MQQGRPAAPMPEATPNAGAGVPPSPNGAGAEKPARVPVRLIALLTVAALALGGYLGYGYWLEQTYYVTTENAQVAGAMIQVGSLSAGRVAAVNVDVGHRVERDQVVATVALPSVQSMTPAGPRMGFLGTDDAVVEVRSPIAGVVVARFGHRGDTVAVGQPIVAVVDPKALWVNANVEETAIGRVAIGQPVEVYVDSLRKEIPGQVVAITPATAATFSLLPQQNASGNFNKVVQLVTVRIAVGYGDESLLLGSSARARIRVR